MLRNATSRLVAAHFTLVAISTALVLGFVYWSTRNLIQAEVREVVQAEVGGLEEAYRARGLPGLVRAIRRRTDDPDNRDGVYLLTGPAGRPLAGNLAQWPSGTQAGEGWVALELQRTDIDRRAQVTAAALLLGGGERLLVGRDARARTAFEQRLGQALIWGVAVMGLLALVTGWLLSRLVLNRIGAISATADEIVAGQMDRRMPVGGGADEFDRLGATLNGMLDRIETLVAGLRMVTDSVAHDLRSPLTRLRGAVEASLEADVTPQEREALLARALEEADHTLRMLSGLIEIARAEAGVGRDQFETVDLGQLAEDAAELFAPAAEDRGIALATRAASAPISGHPQLLAQALANLLENALDHAPGGSTVTVEAVPDPARPALSVADHGPGVPEAERGRVLERFVRLDASRSGSGTGLGLSLVAAVARLHDAELALTDENPGLRVTLRFPAAARQAEAAE